VLVHRPVYDDWGLPKGKVEPDESDEEAALREVEEETRLACELGPELASTAYLDREGREKIVRYWAMTPGSGTLSGAHEVDEARWVPLEEARRRLSYEGDLAVLDRLADRLGARSTAAARSNVRR